MLRHLVGATNLRRGSEEKKGYKTSSNRWVALDARQVQVLRTCSPFLPKSSTSVCPACSSPRFKKRGSEASPRLIDVRLGLKATEHPGSGNSHALDPRPPAFPFSQFLGFVDLAMPPPAPEEPPPPMHSSGLVPSRICGSNPFCHQSKPSSGQVVPQKLARKGPRLELLPLE